MQHRKHIPAKRIVESFIFLFMRKITTNKNNTVGITPISADFVKFSRRAISLFSKYNHIIDKIIFIGIIATKPPRREVFLAMDVIISIINADISDFININIIPIS